MLKKIAFTFLLALPLALGASNAEAGGNSKSTGSIKFTNTSTTQVGLVAVDPSNSLSQATTAAQFTARGGRIINPGESTEFKNLKTGNHVAASALVAPGTTSVSASDFTTSTVSVSKGKVRQINL